MEASDTVEKVDGAEADVVTDAAAQGAGAPAGGGETVDVQGAPETEPDPEAGRGLSLRRRWRAWRRSWRSCGASSRRMM